jgi:dephospho-CoA kinase
MIVAVTGGIGSGKSEFCKTLAELGAGVVVGDELGRRALETNSDLLPAIREHFGDGVFDTEGRLIRKALGDIVFSHPEAKKWLDTRIFPEIYRLLWEDVLELRQKHDHVVVDAAMVYEWGIENDFDMIVVVTAPFERIRENLSWRDGFDENQILYRIQSQIPPEEKAKRADVVVQNDGTLDDLHLKAREFWTIYVNY